MAKIKQDKEKSNIGKSMIINQNYKMQKTNDKRSRSLDCKKRKDKVKLLQKLQNTLFVGLGMNKKKNKEQSMNN